MSHRKLDVDSLGLDDEDFDELASATAGVDAAAIQADAEARAADVAGLLARGDLAGALRRGLDGVQPYGAPSHAELAHAKDLSTKTVANVLASARSTDIAALVAGLSPADHDLLLKYVFRGMASPADYNCTSLLAWHEKLVEVAGVGSIVRVLADRRVI
ncbi:arp2/3 complex subunit [Blastocladiella emersonii ATCC 22665]|nr:arp2/3 complex subunit [Blastocladiella emersonii ATCC 22665]